MTARIASGLAALVPTRHRAPANPPLFRSPKNSLQPAPAPRKPIPDRNFHTPRDKAGLPPKVFLDPRDRRRLSLMRTATAALVVTVTWIAVFVIELLSTHDLAAGTPSEIPRLREEASALGHGLLSAQAGSASGYPPEPATLAATPPPDCAAPNADPMQRVFALLPGDLSASDHAHAVECGRIDVLLSQWTEITAKADGFALTQLNTRARAPVLQRLAATEAAPDLMPLLSFDPAAQGALQGPEGALAGDRLLAFLTELAQADLAQGEPVSGYCLDVSPFGADTPKVVRDAIGPWADRLENTGHESCVAVAAETAGQHLRQLSDKVDWVFVKGFLEPWLDAPPGPLASDAWFGSVLDTARLNVDPDKLVVSVGAFSVDWVSGKPMPETIPYAEAITRLAGAAEAPRFAPEVGNSHASYVDEDGRHHRIWMLDAASAHNQIRALRDAGIRNLGIWSLGFEDPGLWAVLGHGQSATPALEAALARVRLRDYVRHQGTGPFMAPWVRARDGVREVTIDPNSGRITGQTYPAMPTAAVVNHYGRGLPQQLVLTFDDGPHAEFTPRVLEVLAREDVPASFFLLGQNALKQPDLVRDILDRGHEIGSHTYWHPRMTEISAMRARAEVNSVQMLVNGITGRGMRLYREPYTKRGGPVTAAEVETLRPIHGAGYFVAGVEVVADDWTSRDAAALTADIVERVEAGDGNVILLHDGGGDRESVVEALPLIIGTLKAKGYEFVLLSDLLGLPTDVTMPLAGGYSSGLSSVTFGAIGNGWSFLEIVFWTVLGIGVVRSSVFLFLALRRKPHRPLAPLDDLSVTIVIPAYNEAKVIRRSVECALASDYPGIDVIIVNDGSTDATGEIAQEMSRDPRVRVISQPNRGKPAALNAALWECDSDILVCVDADTQIHPRAVRQLVHHFVDPDVGAVAGKVLVGNRVNLLTRLQALEYITAQAIDRRARETFNAVTVVPGAIGAWRSTAVLEAGIYSPETMTEDADLTMSIIRSGYHIVSDPHAIARTEAPATVRALAAQRLRWSLGMLQAVWKHRQALRDSKGLGLFSLVDLAIFGYLMPLLAPLADLFLILVAYAVFSGLLDGSPDAGTALPTHVLYAYLILPALDVVTAVTAFRLDPREDRRLLFLLPVQRLFYRPLLYICVLRALGRAASGRIASWASAKRTGFQIDAGRPA